MPAPVHLDHHATTPCDPAVVEAMAPYWTTHFGNPSSAHPYGVLARSAVARARGQVAALLGVDDREIVFTSGATEADNLAILGVAEASAGVGAHVVTVATEHRAVLDAVHHHVARGGSVTWVAPDAEGFVSAQALADAIRDDTVLVSILHGNNEIGTVQDLDALGAVCRAHGVPLHTDAAQTAGLLPLRFGARPVDLAAVSAHKLYGPKGVGALWVRRRGRPRVRIAPRQHGGGHEGGLRSGTLPVPLIVGFGEAAERALAAQAAGEPARLAALRDRLWHGLRDQPGVTRHGPADPSRRLPHNLHITADGVRSADLLRRLRVDVAASQGSACSTGSDRPSHVLTALGVPDARAWGALRFGLGRSTSEADIDRAIPAVRAAIEAARASATP